jgi:beta-phosphoglucomutase-like phosphatase (HAD superfamily)
VRAPAVLLCDADGNLFPSEEPAFVASTEVTNELLRDLGVNRRFEPDELRRRAAGRNFRATAADLAAEFGAELDPGELDARAAEEKRRVSAYLADVLAPDRAVLEPLERLAGSFDLAVVSSSAQSRLDACFRATALDRLFPADVRFSAEDSLPRPTSKPDPAIYRFAGERLGIDPSEGLAIEDSVPGARSAVAAGFETVGNLLFVPPDERERRLADLRAEGVSAVVSSWVELEDLLGQRSSPPSVSRSASIAE